MMMKTSLSPAMRSKVEKVLGRVAIPERHDPTLAAGSQQARPDLQEDLENHHQREGDEGGYRGVAHCGDLLSGAFLSHKRRGNLAFKTDWLHLMNRDS